jgi:hypothetical protein
MVDAFVVKAELVNKCNYGGTRDEKHVRGFFKMVPNLIFANYTNSVTQIEYCFNIV